MSSYDYYVAWLWLFGLATAQELRITDLGVRDLTQNQANESPLFIIWTNYTPQISVFCISRQVGVNAGCYCTDRKLVLWTLESSSNLFHPPLFGLTALWSSIWFNLEQVWLIIITKYGSGLRFESGNELTGLIRSQSPHYSPPGWGHLKRALQVV